MNIAQWRHELEEWCRSTEFDRLTTKPIDTAQQLALRNAHDLLQQADWYIRIEKPTSQRSKIVDYGEQ